MTTSPIAISGSTGAFGGFVAATSPLKMFRSTFWSRTPSKPPQLSNSTVHQFSHSDQAASHYAVEASTSSSPAHRWSEVAVG